MASPSILPANPVSVRERAGKQVASNGALGAAAGSLGLVAFGGVVWLVAPSGAAWQALGAATVAWFAVSAAIWAVLEGVFGPLRDRDSYHGLRAILRRIRLAN